MKIAIINFSGNVGKTTIARHLLAPRLSNASVLSVESANADEGERDAFKGTQFAKLQEALQLSDDLIVDIGASNIEDLLVGMRRFKGSHEDFDYFVVPTVSDVKQQRDTVNTIDKLAAMGVEPKRVRLIFNRVDGDTPPEQAFSTIKQFLAEHALCEFNPRCTVSENELYQRVKHDSRSISTLANDTTDFKALIAKAASQEEKLKLADALAIKRLAAGVLPELDACYQALTLQ